MTNNDTGTLKSIINDLHENLMIEAGAGTGKTYALVSRVVALVKCGVRMQEIVAITFTEAAAAELSERIRSRLEQLADRDHPDNANDLLATDLDEIAHGRIVHAIAELDQATIQTIHGFASQLLRDRPLDARMPPGWVILDEVETSHMFAERWNKWLEDTLAEDTSVEPEVIGALRYLLNAEVGTGRWRDVAAIFSDNCARLADESVVENINLGEVAEDTLLQLQDLAEQCSNQSDKLFEQLQGAIGTVEAVQAVAADVPLALETLQDGERVDYYRNVGSGSNWSMSTGEVRAEFRRIGRAFTAAVRAAPLMPLLHNLRQFALEYELLRKSEGVATFDDLLVWARNLLRDDSAVREHLQSRYTRILIDEFQDTDPLQAEIAFYLAADPEGDFAELPWYGLPLSPGQLFVVGDPKQSIYRFRGADLGVAELVRNGGQLRPLTLVENRRSQKEVLDWVNVVFGENGLMTEEPGIQAEYIQLRHHDGVQQEKLGASVQIFGEQMEVPANRLRQLQARHVAGILAVYTTGERSELDVYDRKLKSVRKARLSDVCILIQTRTGLDSLVQALEDSNIPYRLEGGSLLFDTQEIWDMLNCLRAIDDPADEVAVVASLRSSAFACSDVDLQNWRDAGGSWNYLSPMPDDRCADSPVRHGLQIIHGYHDMRLTTGVSRLIAEFIRDRRLDDLDLAESRPREAWRRRYFLSEQARAMEYSHAVTPHSPPLTLNKFLEWAEMQQEERTRIADVVVPDSDDDAVRIMTMHASKGLEFPIAILLGLAQNPREDNPAVLFDSAKDAADVKFGDLKTPGFSALEESEKNHRVAEAVRLAYVASTRARDHLLVSMYQSTARGNQQDHSVIARIAKFLPALEGYCTESPVTADGVTSLPTPSVPAVKLPEYDMEQWMADRTRATRQRSLPRAVTPTWLARAGAIDGTKTKVEVEDKDTEPDVEQPSARGRGGTAFGSALHAVLQEIVDLVKTRMPLQDDVSLENLLNELENDVVRSTEFHAAAHGVSHSRGEIARLAHQALRNPALKAAMEAPRLWSEIPVAAEIETQDGPVVIEGILDLLYQDRDGDLVIVDYKSDYIPNDLTLSAKMERYSWQGAAYAAAVGRASGKRVKDVQLLFVRRDEALSIDNLDGLIARLPDVVAKGRDQS